MTRAVAAFFIAGLTASPAFAIIVSDVKGDPSSHLVHESATLFSSGFDFTGVVPIEVKRRDANGADLPSLWATGVVLQDSNYVLTAAHTFVEFFNETGIEAVSIETHFHYGHENATSRSISAAQVPHQVDTLDFNWQNPTNSEFDIALLELSAIPSTVTGYEVDVGSVESHLGGVRLIVGRGTWGHGEEGISGGPLPSGQPTTGFDLQIRAGFNIYEAAGLDIDDAVPGYTNTNRETFVAFDFEAPSAFGGGLRIQAYLTILIRLA